MIQDIKKYNVWIVYVCMWLFSFFTVWYIAIVMYYTLVHVTQSGYASDFIKNISTLSNVPILYSGIWLYWIVLFREHT